MRSIGKIPPARPREDLTPGFSDTYSISVVTPLFGGGFKAGEVDREHPVRGTAIRGHLRFWWRATCGRKFSSSQELYHRESQIWGDTEKASSVRIWVSDQRLGSIFSCASFPQGKNFPKFNEDFPGYICFPFQGSRQRGKEKDPSKAALGTSFSLGINCPAEFKEDLEVALRAWVCFGVLGARTRRGAGSLFCEKLSPNKDDNLNDWMKDHFGDYLGTVSADSDYPTLARGLLLGKRSKEAISVWKELSSLYGNFRQGENLGRNKGEGNRPGRSRWPEADSIRRLLRTNSPEHVPDSSKPEESFPRAAFGLPIITHFKDERTGDPGDTQLYPKIGRDKKDRMASPLIIKPLAISEDKAVPMIVVLNAPLPDRIVLEKGRDVWEGGMDSVVDSRAASYPNSPMAGRSKAGDALEAFMAYAVKNHDFQEVSR
nr:type III-B CRISPR module RAMP protein Cmr1 [uncultured Dethiosulfovibrio sp.]